MRLRGGASVLRRADGEVQVGAEPGRAPVLSGLSEEESALLVQLGEQAHGPRGLRRARRSRVGPARTRELYAELSRHGVLADDVAPTEPDLLHWEAHGVDARERAQRLSRCAVLVRGQGPVASRLTALLAAAGLGAVRSFGQAGDVGGLPAGVEPALAVSVDDYTIHPLSARAVAQSGLGHLPVVVRPLSVRVGPVLEADRLLCATCLALHETDADPAWPLLALQYLLLPAAPVEGLLVEQAAVLAARAVLDCLGDAPWRWRQTSVELGVDEPLGLVRRWEPHPQCLCGQVLAGEEDDGTDVRTSGRLRPPSRPPRGRPHGRPRA
ncbi:MULTISPECIES: thiamine biosynthesis protein ThiF [unclassified Actinomyces]|uniref:thiamine biosynthesis protein ThiF n=1 Tax=unclassified Actinomyces TaxID=2609248 RepID=UPI0020182AAE|nr:MULTISPECIES: thiamine biosynthesis protein ThiF [unclassified Actinomyces]MCL3778065.1 thiamine biosynthesis protein ThiF [Actinomyces sp. AC-20-1]MCL3790626.1 thiamine biosynthesis protein ThiF [Actinomyces sp. 187325]MCL3792882.1 thiamine biosynthesis protein ThiF [Actinomyces sp. 186855]MCL3795362.1 thiamine biosynthesis protein ThiF [Actinomyces sp. 217892]